MLKRYTDGRSNTIIPEIEENEGPMFCVKEYGENIGTLRNFFRDLNQAMKFVEKVIGINGRKYKCIGPHEWYCPRKEEYVKIEKV